jgi:hypothetical protein
MSRHLIYTKPADISTTFPTYIYSIVLSLQRTLSSEGKTPPRNGFVGHITRIANKLIQLANSDSTIQSHLQVYFLLIYIQNFATISVSHMLLDSQLVMQ